MLIASCEKWFDHLAATNPYELLDIVRHYKLGIMYANSSYPEHGKECKINLDTFLSPRPDGPTAATTDKTPVILNGVVPPDPETRRNMFTCGLWTVRIRSYDLFNNRVRLLHQLEVAVTPPTHPIHFQYLAEQFSQTPRYYSNSSIWL
jgi:hypothetical protein